MTMAWFRFYSEFIEDPKISMMSDSDQLLWVKALCLASQSKIRGVINLADEEICWKLRISIEQWKHAIDKFRAKGMIEHCTNGYKITNWDKRQFTSDSSSARVKEHRDKKKDAANMKRFSNVSVTPPDTDTYSESDSNSDPDLNKKDFFFSAENLENSSPEEKKEPDAVTSNPEIQETPPPTPAPLRRADSSKIEYADPMRDRFNQSATRRSQIEPLLGNESFISYLKRELKCTEYYKARKVTDGTAKNYMRTSYLQNTEGEIRFEQVMDYFTEYQRSQLEATQPTASSDRAPMPERSAVPTHLKNLVKK